MANSILITGASGLVGSHVLLRFCMEGIPIRALVRNPERALENIRKIAGHYFQETEQLLAGIEFMQGDLLDLMDIENAMLGIDSVIHCAGMVSFKKKDAEQVQLLNTRVTADLVNVALEENISWFCHISSVAAFGKTEVAEIDENLFWKSHPDTSRYAISKYDAEREVWRAFEEGLPVVMFSPSVVTGPSTAGNNKLSAIFSLLKKKPKWYIPGKTGYVDARDVADAVWFAYSKKLQGEKYILNAENLSHQAFLKICADAAGFKAPEKPIPHFLLKTIGYSGSLLALTGIETKIPDTAMLNTIRGNQEYRNEKFLRVSGMHYREIKSSVQLMANDFQGTSPVGTEDYKPGW